jgi:hypothetical protein
MERANDQIRDATTTTPSLTLFPARIWPFVHLFRSGVSFMALLSFARLGALVSYIRSTFECEVWTRYIEPRNSATTGIGCLPSASHLH